MHLEYRINRTLAYIRACGRLEDANTEPHFRRPVHTLVWRDTSGREYLYREHCSLYPHMMEWDRAEVLFREATADLVTYSPSDLKWRIHQQIKDDPRFGIVDVGSGVGTTFSNYFARCHPRVQTVMIDDIDRSEMVLPYVGNSFLNKPFPHVGFSVKPDRTIHDVETYMNVMLRINGFHNSTYHNVRVEPQSGSICHALHIMQDRHSLVLGFRAPQDLGYAILYDTMRNGQAECVITPSAIERLTWDSATVRVVQSELEKYGCTDGEIEGYLARLHERRPRFGVEKYDTHKSPEWRFGVMLKQLAVLALASLAQRHGYHAHVGLLSGDTTTQPIYNQPSHVLHCHNGTTVLRLFEKKGKTGRAYAPS